MTPNRRWDEASKIVNYLDLKLQKIKKYGT